MHVCNVLWAYFSPDQLPFSFEHLPPSINPLILPTVSLLLWFHIYIKSRTHKWRKTYLSFWDWLNWLNMIISSCIHFPASDTISFFFRTEKTYTVYVKHIFFMYSSANGYLGWFLNLTIAKSTAINIFNHFFKIS